MDKALLQKKEAILANPVFRYWANCYCSEDVRPDELSSEFLEVLFEKLENVLSAQGEHIPGYGSIAMRLYNTLNHHDEKRERSLSKEIIETSLKPDFKTNIFPKSMEELMVLLADYQARKSKEPVYLIGADYCNLGGFCEVMGYSKTSEFINLSAALIRKTIDRKDVDLIQMTNLFGTDELTLIVRGDLKKVESAMKVVKKEIRELVRSIHMHDLEHAKHKGNPAMAGVNIAFGLTELGGAEPFCYRVAESVIEEGIDREKEQMRDPDRIVMSSLEEAKESSRSGLLLSNAIVNRSGLYQLSHKKTSPIGLVADDYANEDGSRKLPKEATLDKVKSRLRKEFGEDWEGYYLKFVKLIQMGRYDPRNGLKEFGTFWANYHDMAEDGAFTRGGYLMDINLRNASGLNSVFCHYDTNSIFNHSANIMHQAAEKHEIRYVAYRTGGKSFRLVILDSDKHKIARFSKEMNSSFEDEVSNKTVGEYMEESGSSLLQGSAVSAKIAGVETEEELKSLKISDIPHKRQKDKRGTGLGIVSTSIDPQQSWNFFRDGREFIPPIKQIETVAGRHTNHVFAIQNEQKIKDGAPVNSSHLFEDGRKYICVGDGQLVESVRIKRDFKIPGSDFFAKQVLTRWGEAGVKGGPASAC